jgi:carboxypeptidase Taq
MPPSPPTTLPDPTFDRLHHLGHLQSLASWDQAANMPPKGNEARAAALAEMAT